MQTTDETTYRLANLLVQAQRERIAFVLDKYGPTEEAEREILDGNQLDKIIDFIHGHFPPERLSRFLHPQEHGGREHEHTPNRLKAEVGCDRGSGQ